VLKKALAVGALLALTACGVTSVDVPALEKNITEEVKKQTGADATVSCPDNVDWKKGGTFTCDVAVKGGTTQKATVTMVDDKGNVKWSLN